MRSLSTLCIFIMVSVSSYAQTYSPSLAESILESAADSTEIPGYKADQFVVGNWFEWIRTIRAKGAPAKIGYIRLEVIHASLSGVEFKVSTRGEYCAMPETLSFDFRTQRARENNMWIANFFYPAGALALFSREGLTVPAGTFDSVYFPADEHKGSRFRFASMPGPFAGVVLQNNSPAQYGLDQISFELSSMSVR